MVDFSEKFTKGVDGENYTPTTYDELGGMIGKIAEQVIRQVSAEDRLAIFDKRPINNGDTIEQVLIELVESTAYDPTGAGALARANPNMVVRYYKDWTRAKFKTTVDMAQLRKVLVNGTGASDIASRIVGVLGESDKYEKYTALKTLLKNAKQEADGGDGDVANALVNYATIEKVDGVPNYKGILTAIKNAVAKMTFVNDTCNTGGILRRTNLDNIVILMPYTLKNEIDVEELSGVFNLDKAELKNRIIEIDSATENGYDYIYIVDKDAIVDYTRLYEMVDQKNGDGLFWNYWLHIERQFGISQLFDGGYIKCGVVGGEPVQKLAILQISSEQAEGEAYEWLEELPEKIEIDKEYQFVASALGEFTFLSSDNTDNQAIMFAESQIGNGEDNNEQTTCTYTFTITEEAYDEAIEQGVEPIVQINVDMDSGE